MHFLRTLQHERLRLALFIDSLAFFLLASVSCVPNNGTLAPVASITGATEATSATSILPTTTPRMTDTAAPTATFTLTAVPFSQVKQTKILPIGKFISIALSPDARQLAFISPQHITSVMDAQNGTIAYRFPVHQLSEKVIFSPAGNLLAEAGRNNILKIWNMTDGTLFAKFTMIHYFDIQFNNDGSLLAMSTSEYPQQIYVWDVAKQEERIRLKGVFRHFAFSPDGAKIAGETLEGNISVRDLSTGSEIANYPDPGESLHAIAYSADGTRLAFGTSRNAIRMVDTISGTQLAGFESHTTPPSFLAFSPKAGFLASLGSGITWSFTKATMTTRFDQQDRILRFWDVESRSVVFRIDPPRKITDVCFDLDWNYLVTGNVNYPDVLLWRMK